MPPCELQPGQGLSQEQAWEKARTFLDQERAAEKTGLGGSESRQTHPDSSGELLGEGVVASLGKPWSVQLTRTRRWEVGKQGWEAWLL